jgi:hypothetical protein
MRSGNFEKLRITSCIFSQTTPTAGAPLTFTAGSANVLPSGNAISEGFPSVVASRAAITQDCVFTGGSISRTNIGTFTGSINSTSSTTTISGISNTTGIQVNDFITQTGEDDVGLLGTGWAIVTAVTANSITVTSGTATNTTGAIQFDVYKRGGFEPANFSMYCLNNTTTARQTKYALVRISIFNYSGGTAVANIDLLLPVNVPVKVQLPNSLITTNSIFLTALTSLSPVSATALDSLAKYTYNI